MGIFVQAIAGLIFGIGLVVSGMANPEKVQNFLDFAGTWDPSLAFVMGGAVVIAFIGYRLAFRRGAPLLDSEFHVPTKTSIDGRLLAGSAVFGIGWGLAGFCPGPALTSLLLAAEGTLIFVPAMIVGLGLAKLLSTSR